MAVRVAVGPAALGRGDPDRGWHARPVPGTSSYDVGRVAARLAELGLDPDRLRFFAAACAERAAPVLTCRLVLRRDPAAASVVASSLPLLWTVNPPRLAEARDILVDLRAVYPPERPPDPATFRPAEALTARAISLSAAVVVAAFECYVTPTPPRAATAGAESFRAREEIARLVKLPRVGDLPPQIATQELDAQRSDMGVLSTTKAPRRAAQQIAGKAQTAGAATATVLMELIANLDAADGR